jgi:hypothetical protein
MATYKVTHNYTLAKITYVSAESEEEAQDIADTLLLVNPEFGSTDEVVKGVLSFATHKEYDYTDVREVE